LHSLQREQGNIGVQLGMLLGTLGLCYCWTHH